MTALLALLAALTLTAPQPIAEVDAGTLKGDLSRLAWSDDGSELYVQSVERDRTGAIKSAHHVLVSVASKTAKDARQEPEWSARYWTWKSGQASPAAPSFRIAVEERTETKRSVAAPAGGAMARGAAVDPAVGTTLSDAANAAETAQTIKVFVLKLKGETIGEWANEPVVPGVNFTWAPAPLTYLAYAKRGGGPIVILDGSGAKQELSAAKAALLPAWSPDGTRIAWLERKGKKYQLTIAGISTQ